MTFGKKEIDQLRDRWSDPLLLYLTIAVAFASLFTFLGTLVPKAFAACRLKIVRPLPVR